MSQDLGWQDLIKKETSGTDDCDLGEVPEIEADLVVTKKGVLDKKNLTDGFNGRTLHFRIMKSEANQFLRDDLAASKT
jgi:hypothetical protein